MSGVTGATTTSTKARLPREVWVLVSANFAIAVGFGLVAPALPNFARSFNVSVTAASIVISAFAFARLAFAPASGRLVTRFGERRVYLTGITIVAVTTGACALATAYWHLVALRTLAGIGSTMFTVSAVGLLIHLTPPPLRGRASGLWGTSFLLGNVAGPILGGGLIAISLRTPFVVYAVTLFIAVGIVWWFLRNSTLISANGDNQVPGVTLRAALRHRSFLAAIGSSFANGWANFGVRVSLVPLFITEVLLRDAAFAGTALAIFAAANVAMLMVSGKISDTIGRKPPVIVGLLVSAAGTVWVGYTDTVTTFVIATVIGGLGTGLMMPPMQATVADIIGTKSRGGPVLAAFQMATDIGAIVGPILAGILADQLSYGVSFAVTGGLAAVAALTWLVAKETLPDQAEPAPTPEQAAKLTTNNPG